jgi:hypothetical protein
MIGLFFFDKGMIGLERSRDITDGTCGDRRRQTAPHTVTRARSRDPRTEPLRHGPPARSCSTMRPCMPCAMRPEWWTYNFLVAVVRQPAYSPYVRTHAPPRGTMRARRGSGHIPVRAHAPCSGLPHGLARVAGYCRGSGLPIHTECGASLPAAAHLHYKASVKCRALQPS